MKKTLFVVAAAFLSLFMKAQDDVPLSVTITFEKFDEVIKGLEVEGYNCLLTANDPSIFSAMFTVNQLNGALGIYNLNFYEMASSSSENFVPVKEYEINGHKAYLGTNKSVENDETPMNVLIVLYPQQKMTILFAAETAIPISTLEKIVTQINF
jgi:hypothetical protein